MKARSGIFSAAAAAAVTSLLSANLAFAQGEGAAPAAGGEAKAPAAAGDTGHCMGANACKGQGECAQKAGKASHDCAGKNACKGKGWKTMSKEECKKAHGKFSKA